MSIMQITNKRLDELRPYENNPRKNDKSVDYVANSISQFGFKVPLVIDKDGVIVAGHTRYKAAVKLKLETVPCIIANDLTDEQIKAFRLADNKVGEFSEWDFDLLRDELDGILDLDMSDFGFDLDFDEEEKEVVEDDFEETETEPRAKLGDIWQLGEHRLMCGDSTNAEDIDALTERKAIDLLLTDPPYGIKIVSGNKIGQSVLAKTGDYMPIKGDESTDSARKSYEAAKEKCKIQILFGGNYFTDFLPPSRCWIVWYKEIPDGMNFSPVELAWTNQDKGIAYYKRTWHGMIREGDKKAEGTKRVHPTQKPASLCGDILKDFSEDGDSVLDLFGGSGSTLIACEQLDRKCYMMELEPHYIDVIIDRWEKFTGKKAVLLNGETTERD